MRFCLFTLALMTPCVALAAGEPGRVEEGKPAPDFALRQTAPGDPAGKEVRLSDYFKGDNPRNVVLFFFPKAMTGGCTKQCKGFTALNAEFAKLDTVAVGISTDTLDRQEQFTARDALTVPLFADGDKEVARKYGVLRPVLGMANRVTFVIDKKGIVRKIYKVGDAEKNPAEVLEFVRENLAGK